MPRVVAGLLAASVVASFANAGAVNKLVAAGGSVTITAGPVECDERDMVKKGDHIVIHYTGTIDQSSKTDTPGKKFDSSLDPRESPFAEDANKEPEPFDFTIGNDQMIDGWEFGLLGLCKGAKATLVVPPELGYGKQGMGGDIAGGATLNFAVEVMSVGEAPQGDDRLVPLAEEEHEVSEHEFEDTALNTFEHEEDPIFEEHGDSEHNDPHQVFCLPIPLGQNAHDVYMYVLRGW